MRRHTACCTYMWCNYQPMDQIAFSIVSVFEYSLSSCASLKEQSGLKTLKWPSFTCHEILSRDEQSQSKVLSLT